MERRQILLNERVEFALEGFRRGGIELTRLDVLEMFKKAAESAGDLYTLILDELDRTKTTLDRAAIERKSIGPDCQVSWTNPKAEEGVNPEGANAEARNDFSNARYVFLSCTENWF